jgi:N-acetylglucosamine-6-phosphate deacetylase
MKINKTLEIIMDSKKKLIKINNGKLITPSRLIENYTVRIDNYKIIKICTGDIDFLGAQTIDAQHYYVATGFIDMHI